MFSYISSHFLLVSLLLIIDRIKPYSESYYLVIVTDSNIEVLEIKAKPVSVNLVRLNKKISNIFYDSDTDMLYFMDSQSAPDGFFYDNVYRLELSSKSYLLNNLMKMRKNDQE